MDRVIQQNPRKRWYKLGIIIASAAAGAYLIWLAMPRGFPVKASDIDVSQVQIGTFRDDLVVRANVVPFASFVLDATEGGNVEAVFVRDGQQVKKGDLLFRLSNPQTVEEVLARAADVSRERGNLSIQRVALADARAGQRRTMSTLEFDLERLKKAHARNVDLAKQGFISSAAMEESADNLRQQAQLLEQARDDGNAELSTREQAIKEMEQAIAGLDDGLRLVRGSADALAVRAPSNGRLTGFQLQQGQSVKSADRLGRIDTPDNFKLTASVDEFYLNRISTGLKGSIDFQGKPYTLTVSLINPQIVEGHFNIELNFDTAPSGLQPGQSIDSHITLGKPASELVLSDGAFYSDTGGSWVFVLNAKGDEAERRNVKLGRRAAGEIEVLDGLQSGERVITSTYRRYGETQRLRVLKSN